MASTVKSRLLWRCRRGTKEMDMLLQQFVDEYYDSLSHEQQSLFGRLLEQPDPDIMDWIMGKAEPPAADIKPIIDIMRTISLRHYA